MILRRIARPLLASVFIADGVSTLRNPAREIKATEPLANQLQPLVEKGNQALPPQVPNLPSSPSTWVKVAAGTKVVAGAALAFGKAPRLAATALAATQLQTAVTRDAFWSAPTETEKSRRRSAFLTDVALLGGLTIAAADTAGKPGLAWRAAKLQQNVSEKLPFADAPDPAQARKAALVDSAHSLVEKSQSAGETAREHAESWLDNAREQAPQVASATKHNLKSTWDAVSDRADSFFESAAHSSEDALHTAQEKLAPVAEKLSERSEDAWESLTNAAKEASESDFVSDAKQRFSRLRRR